MSDIKADSIEVKDLNIGDSTHDDPVWTLSTSKDGGHIYFAIRGHPKIEIDLEKIYDVLQKNYSMESQK